MKRCDVQRFIHVTLKGDRDKLELVPVSLEVISGGYRKQTNARLRGITAPFNEHAIVSTAHKKGSNVTTASRTTVIPVDGASLHVERVGDGDPLLLLHGFTGHGGDWAPFIPTLSETHHLVIPDLRGHGRSTNLRGEFSFRQCAADMLTLLNALDLPAAKAIGLSGGGNTLLHFAVQYPHRITKMVLVSAAPRYPEQAKRLMAHFDKALLPTAEIERLRKVHLQGERQIDALLAHARSFAEDATDMNLTRVDLQAVRAETLVLHGDRDELYPVDVAVELYRSIPNAQLEVWRLSGHLPVYGDAPRFLRTAQSFLAE